MDDKIRKVTIKDVAEAAGVSRATAAFACAGNGRMAPETRQRILDVAAQMNYQPNAVARSLRQRGTHIVGFYSGYGSLDVRNDFVGEIIYGLQTACEAQGYHLILHGTFSGRSGDEIYGEMLSGRIDGLVVLATEKDALIKRLAISSLPVVALADPVKMLPSVSVDEMQGAQMIVDHLWDKGHRRVLYCYHWPAEIHAAAQSRYKSFCRAAKKKGIEIVALIGQDEKSLSPEYLKDELKKYHRKVTACVSWSDGVADLLVDACLQLGWRVPQDFGVVGFNGCALERKPAYKLTTIRAPWSLVAENAVNLLLQMKAGEEVPREIQLPVEFIAGQTT